MKLNTKDKKMLEEYKVELDNKKQYTKEDIELLIQNLKEDPYTSLRALFESQLKRAYQMSLNYEHEALTTLDFVHAANEGLEVAVTSKEYDDYDSFVQKVETSIDESINLMLSFFN